MFLWHNRVLLVLFIKLAGVEDITEMCWSTEEKGFLQFIQQISQQYRLTVRGHHVIYVTPSNEQQLTDTQRKQVNIFL